MNDDVKNELERILTAYDAKIGAHEARAAAARAAQAEFPERFAARVKDTVRPTLEELARVLAGRGHPAELRDQIASVTSADGVTLAALSIRVVPKPFAHKGGDKSYVEVTFAANPSEQKIIVSATNTMSSFAGKVGKCGEYALDAMTGDVVAAHVLSTLRDAFGRPA